MCVCMCVCCATCAHALYAHHFPCRLVERMADGDAEVRKALARLLREQCIPNIEGGALRPFMPMIMAHVCRYGMQ